jgi:hypothetical protein
MCDLASHGVIQQRAVARAGKRDQGRHEHRECDAALPSRHLTGRVA